MISRFLRSGKNEPKFYCESCGKEVPPDDSSCPKCGKQFKAVMCPRCGLSGRASLFTEGCPDCGYQAPSMQSPVRIPRKEKSSGLPEDMIGMEKENPAPFREYSSKVFMAVIIGLVLVLGILLFLFFRL